MMRRQRRGVYLAFTLLLLIVISFLITSLIRLVPQEINSSARTRQDSEAYYAATSGLKLALNWIDLVLQPSRAPGDNFSPKNDPFGVPASDPGPFTRTTLAQPASEPFRLAPVEPTTTDPQSDDTYFPPGIPMLRSKPGAFATGGEWACDVYVFPDKLTPPHPFLGGRPFGSGRPPCYTLLAFPYLDFNRNGTCDTALGEKYVIRMETSAVAGTFARIAYFADQWPSTLVMRAKKSERLPVVDGPLHTNGVPHFLVEDGLGFWNEAVTPTSTYAFGGPITFAGTSTGNPNYDGIHWVQGNFNGNSEDFRPHITKDGEERSVPERYRRLLAAGESAIRARDRIPLPANTNEVAVAAWGEDDPAVVPNFQGFNDYEVYVRDLGGQAGGGVVLKGGTQETVLQVIKGDGTPLSNSDDTYNSNTPTDTNQANSAIKYVMDTTLTYVAGEDVQVSNQFELIDTQVTGEYTLYDEQVSTQQITVPVTQGFETFTASVPSQVVVGTIYASGQVGVGGGTPQYSTTLIETQVVKPVIRQVETTTLVTNRVPTAVTSGPFTSQISVVTGSVSITETLFATYVPTDYIIEAIGSDVRLDSAYFGGTINPGDNPLSEVQIPKGFVALVKNVRMQPGQYTLQLMKGPFNGAYYGTGKYGGFRGWNRGPKTFNTPGDIEITGPVRQFGTEQGKIPARPGNPLGLFSRNVRIRIPNSQMSGGAGFSNDQPLYLYAALLAYDGVFDTANLAELSRTARLQVIGSVAQKAVGLLSEPSRGWGNQYRFDPNNGIFPPPFFPRASGFEFFYFRYDHL